MGKKIDLTGQQFGRLIVLYDTGKREPSCGHIIWHCKCNCGNEIDVNGASLRSGKTQSCGCITVERSREYAKNRAKQYDLTGQKFGKLVVIGDDGKRDNNGNILWKCKCECGNIHYVIGYLLKNGSTKSCGCIGRSYGEYLIQNLLMENNIPFETQKRFDDCKDKNTLPFDFYINNNYIIEFDGSQHYECKNNPHTWNNKENLIKVQEHDKIKNEYCFNNNIPIIRIPYWHINDLCLEDLLLKTSKFILKNEK